MKKLTAATIDSLKAPEHGRLEVRDTEVRGLAIRVTEKGAKSWCLWYWNAAAKRKRRLTLGDFPAITLAAARELAREHKTIIAKGGDPAATKQTAEVPKTVGEVMSLYIEHGKRNHKRSWQGEEWKANKHVLPFWKNRLLRDITRAMSWNSSTELLKLSTAAARPRE
jgi:hypothetical protein